MARNGLAHNEPYLWNGRYMVYNGKLVHRLVYEQCFGKIPKGLIIHHRNGNRLDNRIENLVLTNRAIHIKMHERKPRGLALKPNKNSVSGVPGVTFHKSSGQWRVRVGKKYIGIYRDIDAAVAARQHRANCLK